MAGSLDNLLNRALQTRLALQVTLSSLPTVEEWMDIHLDRWLEHLPLPPEMPDGHAASCLAAVGSDLRRVWWGAWGDPRGFVPKMASYFKLCNLARSDEQALDQLGEALQPALVGSWVGVWGGRVVTGWHFWDPHEFARLAPLFGTHEAKFLLTRWVAERGVERFQRFTQSIGDGVFSEVELALPGETAADRVAAADDAFAHFTGGRLPAAVADVLRAAAPGGMAIAVRIGGGKVSKLGVLADGMSLEGARDLCAAARLPFDDKLERVVNTLSGDGLARVELGRAGEHAGCDLYVEPGEPARRPGQGEAAASAAAQAN